MRKAPALSVCLHSASRDGFLATAGIDSASAMVVDMLNRQTFKDIEFVFIDYHYEENREMVASLAAEFPIKHAPVHPQHCFWKDRGAYSIGSAKNSAFLYCDADLIFSIDDGAAIDPDTLEKVWLYWKNEGRYVQSIYRRYRTIKTRNWLPVYPISGELKDEPVHADGRVFEGDVHRHDWGGWCFGGVSFSLADVIALNGVDESYDPAKQLEDCSWGVRLQQHGAKFVVDRTINLNYFDHPSYSDAPDGPREFIAIDNQALIRIALELKTSMVANVPGMIGERELALIREETLSRRGFDPLDAEHIDNFNIWKQTPTFNLRDQRAELRDSAEWKWDKTMKQMTYSEILAARTDAGIKNGWCSEAKATLLMQTIFCTKPKTIVEIGVYDGHSLLPMAMLVKQLGVGSVYGIDPWDNIQAAVGAKNPENVAFWGKVDLNKFHTDLIECIAALDLGKCVNLIHDTSEAAVTRFPDASINVLHVDGNHAGDAPMRDVTLYLPKVAIDGFIFMDDVGWTEKGVSTVKPALNYLLAHGCTLVEEANNNAILQKNR